MRTWVAILWSLATAPVVFLALERAQTAWVAFLVYETGCALAAWYGGGSLGPRPRWLELFGAAAAGFLAVFATGTLAHTIGLRPPPPSVWGTWGLAPPGDAPLLLAYVAINPWVEEWFWRGTLLAPSVRRRVGAAGSRALAAVGFVPFHLVFLFPSFGLGLGSLIGAGVFLAALIWVALRERQNHAWGAAASHCGADLGLVGLYLLFLRGASAIG